MSLLLTVLSSHLLSEIENELIKSEPAIVEMIINEINLLVTKLQAFIDQHAPKIGQVVDPILSAAENVTERAINAAGDAAVNGA